MSLQEEEPGQSCSPTGPQHLCVLAYCALLSSSLMQVGGTMRSQCRFGGFDCHPRVKVQPWPRTVQTCASVARVIRKQMSRLDISRDLTWAVGKFRGDLDAAGLTCRKTIGKRCRRLFARKARLTIPFDFDFGHALLLRLTARVVGCCSIIGWSPAPATAGASAARTSLACAVAACLAHVCVLGGCFNMEFIPAGAWLLQFAHQSNGLS